MPEISVVIPTHNRWQLLSRTLAGALAQEGVDLEVIVVNDASSDATATRLGELDLPNLRVINLEVNAGQVAARNRGLEQARGEWIGFLDDDDLWAPDKLRRQLDAARAADAGLAYSGCLMIDEALEIIDSQHAPDPDGILDEILCRQALPGGASNMIVKTEIARRVGGFDPRLKVAEDWDMWIRLLLACDGRAACSEEYLYGYYQHATSAVIADRGVFVKAMEYIENEYAGARRERGVEFDTVNISRWLGNAYRRAGDRRGAARIYLRSARKERDLGSALRAIGVFLGEPVARRFAGHEPAIVPTPPWLSLYRPGGRLESVAALDADPA
jgi:hypothetical protein